MTARTLSILLVAILLTACGGGFETEATSTSVGVGSVPEAIVSSVLADASRLSDLPEESLSVVRAEAVDWPDGSLGCPEPGKLYTQAIVAGYWVIVESPDRVFDYRITADGRLELCEDP